VRKGVGRERGEEGRERGRGEGKGCPVFLDNNVGNPIMNGVVVD